MVHSCLVVTRNIHHYLQWCGPDSSFGTTTRYRLDGPGIESRWGPTNLLYNGYRVFSEGKAAGAWR